MAKLLLHLILFAIILHLPALSYPTLYLPDMVAVALLTARVQNHLPRLPLAAIVAGLVMDALSGVPYGITSLRYLLMLYIYVYIAQRTNQAMSWIFIFWAALAYILAKYTIQFALECIMGAQIFSGSDGYSVLFTVFMIFVWIKCIRYEAPAYAR